MDQIDLDQAGLKFYKQGWNIVSFNKQAKL